MAQRKTGVVGAGLMGAEIALVFALAGDDVILSDRDAATVAAAIDRLAGILDRGIGRGFYDEADKARALAGIRAVAGPEDYGDRDLVVEAVFEDKAVKAETFARLDPVCAPGCVFASNTSTIPISTLAASVGPERRSRFLGAHFFSPVSRMKLVEIISGLETDAAIADWMTEACREAGKTPVRVKDVAGFAVNRLLHALMIEATRLVEEGVASPADIDTACKLGLGHPVGPFELMDIVTNRLTLQVQEILHEAYGPRFLPRPLLKQMVDAGHDGRKAGKGWVVKG